MNETDVKYPDIEVRLTEADGNAFAVIGIVLSALRRGGASVQECNAFVAEATKGDYDNVLQTVMRWVTVL